MTAVVIGAGSGMGRAVAALFADEDRLVLADRGQAALTEVAEVLTARGALVEAVPCDITDAAAVRRLAEVVGEFRALVHTAGLSPTMAPGPRIYDVNLRGTALVLNAFLDYAGPGSAAVCFASTAGHMMDVTQYAPALDDPLAPDFAERLHALGGDSVDDPAMAYVLSKAGVMRLVRKSAAAWGARGARVVSISPGIIDTPMGRQEYESQPAMADMVATTPLQRQASAEEVARVAQFLCSDGASFVSACDVLVDGGYIGSNLG
jgi:NAD(P)-dependent dehydrogenase (short-subunit alcohol dehydrogenase family)